jgi:uncharacterized repeat protein (TIGR03803 family)
MIKKEGTKMIQIGSDDTMPHPFPATGVRVWLLLTLLPVLFAAPSQAADRQFLNNQLPAAVTNAAPLRHFSRWGRLNLTIGLPLRDRAGLTNLLQQLYDPASPNFRHYLTPEQFAQRFGPTEEDYQAVVRFAQSHGLAVTGHAPNRTLVNVRGTVASVERAFHVTLNEYQHPTEARTFYAPDVEPSLDLTTPILSVSGLDNYVVPHPCLRLLNQPKADATGSGPGGTYLGNDFRSAYLPGVTLTGSGQNVGILEFDSGYFQSDITAYELLADLPNVPVSAVLLDGYNGGPGIGNDEVSLDIEMAISMAPGLAEVIVYEGSSADDILNRMATDNLAKQLGASWSYALDENSDQIFMQFAAQGQSFFNSSGDSDAYTAAPTSPTDDPNITIVGGTTLTTVSTGGAWASETVWNEGNGEGSSGGISTRYTIPSWQQGISMTTNQGSTTMRNIPDVAMTADNVYGIYGGGQSGEFIGTSISAQLWAAFTAVMNQLAVTNGEATVGFINPAIYAIGKGSNVLGYTSLFHDTTNGNNEKASSPNRFVAVPGYDLCTGLGTPNGGSFITAVGLPEPLQITPLTGAIFSGPVGGPFDPASETYSLTNNSAGSLNWSLANTSSWFTVSPMAGTIVQGGPAETVTVSVTLTATNLPAGSYSAALRFTNLGDNFGQTRQLTLAVVTPPVIIAQPTNQSLLEGMTATFSVGMGPNALMFYQWQDNGLNLRDEGNYHGTATSTLTISNISGANVGSYSVVLSNAAGVLTSSNATLTYVQSQPVIVLQPANQTALPGATASFSVGAVGNTPFAYHWQFNGTDLVNNATYLGVTTKLLTITNVSTADAGTYSVTVSDFLGSTNSSGALLSVIPVTAPGLDLSPVVSFPGGDSGEELYSPIAQGTDGNLYGTTIAGGSSGDGTVFKATTNGVLTTLVEFRASNGSVPYGGLFLGKDGFFYGAAGSGGTYDDGTLFKITTSGELTTLTMLDGNNSEFPVAGLVQGSDGNFYGTALDGGAYGYGTIFRMTTGGALTTLVSFNLDDGANPSSALIQGSDGNFYGTTEDGGAYNWGTVFKMTPSGDFTNLYSFTGGSDGGSPVPGLVQAADGNYYGTTFEQGADGFGTVFEITSSGALTTRYTFADGKDGGNPWGGLVQAVDGNLYGTTQGGGAYGFGTVFQIAPTGLLATMAQFDGYTGAYPSAALVQGTDGNLYGTTVGGGLDSYGVIYRLGINGPLQITGQPADQSAYAGGTAAFTVATFGAAPVSYQWQQNGVNLTNGGGISGANAATLSITNVSANYAAVYTVVVSNAVNSVTSDYAVLEVIRSPPRITTQPLSQTCVVGMTVTLTVAALSDEPFSYQWQEDGTNLTDGGAIAGSATSSLTISNVTLASDGTYSVIVSNAIDVVSSDSAVLTVLPVTPAAASMTNLHVFSGAQDGAFPYGGIIEGNDGNLYGTAEGGGQDFDGAIFRMTFAGTLTTLYSFPNSPNGANPIGGLVLGRNGDFYGTAAGGGANSDGATFRMTPNPILVKYLYSFDDGADGATPAAPLVQGSDGNFYGTAYQGGAHTFGSVFKMAASGALTPLYGFLGGDDGGYPYAGVIQGRDGDFYGTTLEFGSGGFGTVFRLATDGTLNTLVSFDETNGAFPQAGVIQGADGNLYGTTFSGGSNDYGTVFCLTTNGSLTTLFSFDYTNGSNPAGSLVQGSDGNLYGTTSSGGSGGQGTAFRITTNGTLATLLWFDGLNGADSEAPMVQASDGNFYGTTAQGGTGFNPSAGGGNGAIFRLTVPIFISNSITLTSAIACLPYATNISVWAIAPQGDLLNFAKVSGPAWLNVATNGVLSGTPANSDIGTNMFVVSLTDSNGVSASANVIIPVIPDPPPAFIVNPFAEPWANVDEAYSGTIATNATDPELGEGDILTFAKISGPAWLNVATNGILSGTPEDINAGTNTFLVSVTNLGGASNTATMSLYVNSAPSFLLRNFTTPAATVGILYSGTIATNATDPDLGAGDTLSFSKVSGPAWLNVAANGGLSGVPSSANLGANAFMVLVVDSGGLAATGNLSINVNADSPPSFTSNPFAEPPVTAGQPYAGTIATNASDPNIGDALTFSKVSGSAWLSVAGNGGLSGTPLSGNVGTNAFIVNVSDLDGLSNNATMYINVTPAAAIVVQISPQGSNLMLTWTGGIAPYQVKVTTDLNSPVWQNLGSPASVTNLVLSPSNVSAYYQIQGQ